VELQRNRVGQQPRSSSENSISATNDHNQAKPRLGSEERLYVDVKPNTEFFGLKSAEC
jgi:hypothetical protein